MQKKIWIGLAAVVAVVAGAAITVAVWPPATKLVMDAWQGDRFREVRQVITDPLATDHWSKARVADKGVTIWDPINAYRGFTLYTSGEGPVARLVTMTGAKTGHKRTIPLIYIPHGEEVILVASQGGMSTHPLWFYNIRTNPEIAITAEGRTRRMLARLVDDAGKAAVWPVAVAAYPDFVDYQSRTTRNIPVFVCTPI